jgi:protein-S-isoprenylcysteine O-methyltransferase Ste14
LLFATAGTLDWPSAWVFLVTSAIIGPPCGLWLAKTDPALLAERMRPTFQADQPAADKKFMLTFVVVALIWLVAIGLDRRAQASNVPLALQALGLAMYLLSTGFIMWVFRENSFAAPVVKVRAERHHRVISSGPYAFVRHPKYSGNHAVLRRRPAAAEVVVGCGDRAGIRRPVLHTRPHRGARAGRGTA